MTPRFNRYRMSFRAQAVILCAAAVCGLTGASGRATGATLTNPVAVENQQPGSDLWQWWLDPTIRGRADDVSKQIKGYASATSVNKGGTISFSVTVNPAPQTYRIKFYRM